MEVARRPRHRLHLSTWLVLILPAALLGLANIPGEHRVLFRQWYTDEEVLCEHGWPLVWLTRQGLPGNTLSVWALADDVCDLDCLALVGDLLVATTMLVLVAAASEWRRRRRHRIWQFSIADLLLAITLLSAGMAFIVEQRNTILQVESEAAGTAWGDNRTWEIALPTWLRDLLPDAESVDTVIFQLGLLRPDEQSFDLPVHRSQLATLNTFIGLGPERVWITVPAEEESDHEHSTYRFDPVALRSLTNLRHLVLEDADDAVLECLDALPELRTLVFEDECAKISTEGAKHLRSLRKLRAIEATQLSLGDAGIAAVASLSNLEVLKLTGVSAADIRQVAGLPRLKFLTLTDTTANDADLAPLAALLRLEKLDLQGRRISGVGLAALARLPWLRAVDVRCCGLTDEGLGGLARLEGLSELSLSYTAIAGRGLPYLAGLRKLRRLDLSFTEIDDSGLANLPDFPLLEELSLIGTRITEAGICHINRLASLRELNLINTRVAHLRSLDLSGLPELRVILCGGSWVDRQEFVRLWTSRPSLDEFIRGCGIGPEAQRANYLAELTKARQRVPVLTRPIHVSLEGAAFGDTELSALHGLAALETLRLESTRVSNAGVATLAEFRRLREIDLADTQIGDAALTTLADLPALEHLDISYTAVTSKGVARLAKFPSLQSVGLDPSQMTMGAAAMLSSADRIKRVVINCERAPWGAQYRGARDIDEFLGFLRGDLPGVEVSVKNLSSAMRAVDF